MRRIRRTLVTFVFTIAICSILSEAKALEPAQQARQILDAAGFKGGLIVHVGCGDSKLTAALCAGDGYLVYGLDNNADNVEQARKNIESLGLYGKVSAETWTGSSLPLTDNLVNLLVLDESIKISEDEVMRILAPNGIVIAKKSDTWSKKIKAWPKEIDEWTHFLHGPNNNAVSHDTLVGPPHYLQWQGEPKFARAHEQLASLGACVSAGGRIFYIIDETPRVDIRIPSQWMLVARDAFNGVILWKRAVASWADQFRAFRAGPPDLAFRLVAGRDRIYVTLGIDEPVSVLDPATGKTLWVYKNSENASQIVNLEDKVFLLIDSAPQTTAQTESEVRRGIKPAPGLRRIVAFDAESNRVIWERKIEPLVHPTLTAEGNRLFYQTLDDVFCLDIADGDELWHSSTGRLELKGHEVGWESPTLVVQDGVVYSADFKQMIAFSAKDGRQLWNCPSWQGYNSPPDVFVIDELVWTKGKNVERNAFDPLTGIQKKELTTVKGYMHHRCYRNKATDRFIMLGNQGVQFLDINSSEIWQNYWIRGTCQYGIMPANGFLYVTPDSCACNLTTKLNGLFALAADRRPAAQNSDDVRLEKGSAYGHVSSLSFKQSLSWPMYRHDAERSGITAARINPELKTLWQADLDGRLSSMTAENGKLFVASIDKHAVIALGQKDGGRLWSYTAGGRIDSPPTIYKGMVLFGSADGYVYALRADDGELVWRFRAAPEDRRTFVNGQLESVWPVHGSVLIKDGVVIVAAGRSSYLDGGIRLYKLEPETGKQISSTVIYSPDPQTGKQPADAGKEMRGLLSDILLADGDNVYMRHVKLDFETGSDAGSGLHVFTPLGFLDDTWWHRGYWVLNDEFLSHWSAWWRIGNEVASGRILAFNESSIFGYGRDRYVGGNTGQWRGGEKYQLFAYERSPDQKGTRQAVQAVSSARKTKARQDTEPVLQYRWAEQVPMFVTAMVIADKTMFIAGPPDVVRTQGHEGQQALMLENPQDICDTWAGKKGALLRAVSTGDGRKLAEYKLDSPPVFDGMAATNGCLYLSMKNGSLICLANE